jgi:hypothetical protein
MRLRSLLIIYFILVVPRAQSGKLRLTNVGDPPRCPRDTPLYTKVGTKINQQVAVA